MRCPKCDEGLVKRIKFKDGGETAYLCEYCGALWLKNEEIKQSTGHSFRSYTRGENKEYTIEETYEEDPDAKKEIGNLL